MTGVFFLGVLSMHALCWHYGKSSPRQRSYSESDEIGDVSVVMPNI